MRRISTIASIALLAISIAIPSSNAAIKSGNVCKKADLTTIDSGRKYTCVKQGSKLVWKKVVVAKTPTPTPTPTPPPSNIAYVLNTTGDDNTGTLGVSSLPYLTIEGAATDLLANNIDGATVYIMLMGSGTYVAPGLDFVDLMLSLIHI